MNRLSFYEVDRISVMNLCIATPKSTFDGMFYPSQNSFWYSGAQGRPMDMLEYALFQPHEKLRFEGEKESYK